MAFLILFLKYTKVCDMKYLMKKNASEVYEDILKFLEIKAGIEDIRY